MQFQLMLNSRVRIRDRLLVIGIPLDISTTSYYESYIIVWKSQEISLRSADHIELETMYIVFSECI